MTQQKNFELFYLSLHTVDILIILVSKFPPLPFPFSKLSIEKHSPSSSSSSLSLSVPALHFFHFRLVLDLGSSPVFQPRPCLEETIFSPLSMEERDRRIRRHTNTLRICKFSALFQIQITDNKVNPRSQSISWSSRRET